MSTGTLYVISAPSGCGKTSLVGCLLRSTQRLCVSVSHTTRPPRPGERPGIDYHFVDKAYFEQLIASHALLEYAEVFGYYYGSSANWIQEKLQSGLDVILEIDWQGAQQIRKQFPSAVTIFILPPSWETLESRLQQRGQDKPAIIKTRLQEAKAEVAHYAEYDYLIVNTHFDQAVSDLQTILQAKRLRQCQQQHQLRALLQTLLGY
jgi:guanylate kinase